MKKGFTLAEVLISLGIIGVVAAMTIPTLISNINGAQFKTAYKKTISTLNQAIKMNIALDEYDFSELAADTTGDGSIPKSMSYILKNRLKSVTNVTDKYNEESAWAPSVSYTVIKTCSASEVQAATQPWNDCYQKQAGDKIQIYTMGGTSMGSNDYAFSLADGTVFAYRKTARNCTGIANWSNPCIGIIDVNGTAGPNQVIDCDSGTWDSCVVSTITDVYPVYFYGDRVEPGTEAARIVLSNK